jgi:hypothetical protein
MLDFGQIAVMFEELNAKIEKPAASDIKRLTAYLECQQKGLEYLKALHDYYSSQIKG